MPNRNSSGSRKVLNRLPRQVRRYSTRQCSKTGSGVGNVAITSALHQRTTSEMEEDVLQRTSAHQHAARKEVTIVHLIHSRVTVGRVQQDPVRQYLDAITDAIQLA